MKIYLVAAGFMAFLVCPVLAAEGIFSSCKILRRRTARFPTKRTTGRTFLSAQRLTLRQTRRKQRRLLLPNAKRERTRKDLGIGRTLILGYDRSRRSCMNARLETSARSTQAGAFLMDGIHTG